MRANRLSLITPPLLLLLSLLLPRIAPDGAGFAQSKSKTWPVQTKGQEGLRAPQEASTLPVPTSGFSKPVAKVEQELPPLVRRGAGEWRLAGGWRLREAPKVLESSLKWPLPVI